jgi:hypothetical protein
MGRVTISAEGNDSLSVTKYKRAFGHGPSMEAYKFMSPEELDQKALNAVKIGEPIGDWKNRHKTPTGTILDKAYGITISASLSDKK